MASALSTQRDTREQTDSDGSRKIARDLRQRSASEARQCRVDALLQKAPSFSAPVVWCGVACTEAAFTTCRVSCGALALRGDTVQHSIA